MRNSFTALVAGVLATVGESLKTLVVVGLPKENELNSFKRSVGLNDLMQRDDVILLENPLNISNLQEQLSSHKGTFDRAIVQSHGGNQEDIPTMYLGAKFSSPITEIISTLNQDNAKTLKRIHLSSCFIGNNFEQVERHNISSHYHQELQKSLQDGQALFLHGDRNTGTTGSFDERVRGIVEHENYSMFDLITSSGETISVVTKKHGNLRGTDQLKTFSPPIFGRKEEEFSQKRLRIYLNQISEVAAEFEKNNLNEALPPPPPTDLDSRTSNNFLEKRFISDAHKFADKGDFNSIRLMLSDGANPDSRTNNGRSFLHNAADYLDPQIFPTILHLFLEKGADIDLQDFDGLSPLMFASYLNQTEAAITLIENNANLDLQDNLGRSALMFAVMRGNIDITRALLEKGAKPNLKSSDGHFALSIAVDKGSDEIAKLLMQHHNGATLLMDAIKIKNLKTTELLFKCGADINIKNDAGLNAFEVFLRTSNLFDKDLEFLELLLKNGADPNTKTIVGTSMLSQTIMTGSLKTTELLLKYGIDPRIDKPLQIAVERYSAQENDENKKVVQLLIDHGAKLSEDVSPTTLSEIVSNEKPEVLKFLLENGINANTSKLVDGSSLLMRAAQCSQLENVKLLLQHDADPEYRNPAGSSVLDVATNTEIIDLITQKIGKPKDENIRVEKGNLRGTRENGGKMDLGSVVKGVALAATVASAFAGKLSNQDKKDKGGSKTQ